jgi:hypothetical protein
MSLAMFKGIMASQVDSKCVAANKRNTNGGVPSLPGFLGNYPSLLLELGERGFGAPIFYRRDVFPSHGGYDTHYHLNLRLKKEHTVLGSVKPAPMNEATTTRWILFVPMAETANMVKSAWQERYRIQLQTVGFSPFVDVEELSLTQSSLDRPPLSSHLTRKGRTSGFTSSWGFPRP